MDTKFARNDRVTFTPQCRRVTPGTLGVVTGSAQGFYQVFATEIGRVVNVRATEVQLHEAPAPLPTLEPVEEAPSGPVAHNAAKTHCPAGHPYDNANTYICPKGFRQCRACRAARKRTSRVRKAQVSKIAAEKAVTEQQAHEDALVADVQSAIVEETPAPEPESSRTEEGVWQIGDEALIQQTRELVKVIALGADGQVVVEAKDGGLEKLHTARLQRPLHAKIEEAGREAGLQVLGHSSEENDLRCFAKGYSKALRDLAVDREPTISLLRELQL